MIVYAVEVTVPLANSVATLVRVGSSPTVVGLPVLIAAETSPLHRSSMKTAVGSSVRLPPVSVTCVSDCSWILPGMKPLNTPETGAWRWKAPKSRFAYDPGRMLILTGTPRLFELDAGQRPYL